MNFNPFCLFSITLIISSIKCQFQYFCLTYHVLGLSGINFLFRFKGLNSLDMEIDERLRWFETIVTSSLKPRAEELKNLFSNEESR